MSMARGRFTQSGPFRAMLSEYEVADTEPDRNDWPMLLHTLCMNEVLVFGEDTDMATVVDAILDHDCPDYAEVIEP